MRQRYRAVVIGCGKIGVLYEGDRGRASPKSHAGALVANPRTELAALVDSDPKKLNVAKKFFPSARTYRGAATCISREKPDIVVIATPARTHRALVKLACAFGVKMIICEKPLSDNSKNATKIARLAKSAGTVLVLNYQRRFFPLFERIRRELAHNAIGHIQQVTCYYDNGLYNNGGHALDAVMFLLGGRIHKVSGILNQRNKTHPLGDANIDGILETESGIRIALQSFDQRAYAIHHIVLFGTTGSIKIVDHGFTGEWSSIKNTVVIPAFTLQRRIHEKESFVRGALDEVIRCYEKKQKPRSGSQNGMNILSVLDALSRSAAESGKRVTVRYI